MKGNVLVLGGYLGSLKAAKQAKLNVIYVQKKEYFQSECIDVVDQAIMLDYTQEELLTEIVRALHLRNPIQWIVTFSEDALLPAAKLANSLGIDHHEVELVEMLKDKYKMRLYLNEKKFAPLAFALGNAIEDVLKFGIKHGYPLIIKPIQGTGSYGVLRLNNIEEVKTSLSKWLKNKKLKTFLIEEYLFGKEVSVEAFTMGTKQHRIVAITDKLVAENFVERGHCVPATLSKNDQERIEAFVQRFLSTIGLEYGPSHTELKITPERIDIIESHNRVGGDQIFKLTELTTGVDMVLWTFELLSGQVLTTKKASSAAAAIQFLELPRGTISEIDQERLPHNDDHLIEYRLAVKKGQQIQFIEKSIDRPGYVLAIGSSSKDAISQSNRLVKQMHDAISYKIDVDKIQRKHLLFIEMNESSHGPDALREAHTLGYEVTFLTIGLEHYYDNTRKLISDLATRIIVMNTYGDFENLIKEVTNLHDKHPINGVYASSDFEIETAARLTDTLDLPGHSFEAVSHTRNKALMRNKLNEAGIPQPNFQIIHSEQDINEAVRKLVAEGVSFPYVLKPVDSSASDGVQMVYTVKDIKKAYRNHIQDLHFRRGYYKNTSLLLEEYVPGDLVSAEVILSDEGTLLLGFTGRKLSELPYFVELEGMYPNVVVNELSLMKYVNEVVETLGLCYGPLHIELVNGSDGPKIVEVNVRLVGSTINKLISASRNVNILQELMRMMAGDSFDFGDTNKGFGLCYMVEPLHSGKLQNLHVDKDIQNVPGFVQIKLHKKQGDSVRMPVESNFDGLATITVFCENKEAAYHCVTQCLEYIHVDIAEKHNEFV